MSPRAAQPCVASYGLSETGQCEVRQPKNIWHDFGPPLIPKQRFSGNKYLNLKSLIWPLYHPCKSVGAFQFRSVYTGCEVFQVICVEEWNVRLVLSTPRQNFDFVHSFV
jgi:hypothetical protein